MLFFWTFYSSKNPEKKSMFPQKYEAAWLFSTLIIIINVCWAANQHIRMISEGSCDTEDWINDAENSALITGINYSLQYIQKEKHLWNVLYFYRKLI